MCSPPGTPPRNCSTDPYATSPVKKIAKTSRAAARFHVKGAQSDSSDDETQTIAREQITQLISNISTQKIQAQIKFHNDFGISERILRQVIVFDISNSSYDEVNNVATLIFTPKNCTYFAFDYDGRYSPITIQINNQKIAKFSLFTQCLEDPYNICSLDGHLKAIASPISAEELGILKGPRRQLFVNEPSALLEVEVGQNSFSGAVVKIEQLVVRLNLNG